MVLLSKSRTVVCCFSGGSDPPLPEIRPPSFLPTFLSHPFSSILAPVALIQMTYQCSIPPFDLRGSVCPPRLSDYGDQVDSPSSDFLAKGNDVENVLGGWGLCRRAVGVVEWFDLSRGGCLGGVGGWKLLCLVVSVCV